MTFHPFNIQAGVVKDLTAYAAEGTYVDSNLIRFKNGTPEQLGGWEKLTTTKVLGVPRDIYSWILNDGRKAIAIGTHRKFYIYMGGEISDITPLRATVTLANPFATTSGSDIITVTHNSHGAIAGAFVTFTSTSTFNNVTVSGEYEILTVPNNNSYTIQVNTTANATGSGGGAAVNAAYQINPGAANSNRAYGWGTGQWGAGTWGTPRLASNVILELRTWSIASWGEDLLINPRGGNLYLWDASAGVTSRASLVTQAPINNSGFIVSNNDGHLLVYGANGNPRLLKWCNQGDFTNWIINETTTSGEIDIAQGDEFITAIQTRHEILLWTRSYTMFSLRYVGELNATFALTTLASNISLIGPNAVAELNGIVYWMGIGHLYCYDGMIRILECPCNSYVFNNIDSLQGSKVVCGTNEKDNEVFFFYSVQDDNDKYLKIALTNNIWDVGSMPRTSWLDSGTFETPLATDANGYLYRQEVGDTADGDPMQSYVQTSFVDIDEGDNLMFIKRVFPDFTLDDKVSITFYTLTHPQNSVISKGTFTITPTTKVIWPRVRGREIAVKISGVSGHWKLGKMQFDRQPDGGR